MNEFKTRDRHPSRKTFMTYMTTTYFHSVKNYLFSSQPSTATHWLLVAFFVLVQTFAFGQVAGDYQSNGTVTFAAATNWQIFNGSTWVTATSAPKDASYTSSNTITVRDGHNATISITVAIAAQLSVLGTFTLNSGANLSIGSVTVDKNGPGEAVFVNAGSALTVNGNFTVIKGDIDVAGTVYINGNYLTTTGNVDVIGGGSMASSGTMITQGAGTIFGSTENCTTGPCSGTSLNCQGTISPASQVICANSQSGTITFTRSGANVVKWQSTTDFLNFTDISNTTTTLPAQTVTQTTRFRAVYTSSGCTGNINSPYATVTVNPAPTTAAAGVDQSKCNTATFTLEGNNPTVGTGAWTLVIGTATITTPTSNTSGVTGVTAGTSATLRWTISNGSCTSTDDVVLTNNTVPSAPTGSSSQSFCSGATVANLAATGTATKWYATASGGTALATTTALVNNTHYYASQTIGCESTSRLDVTAIVNTTNTWTGTTNTSWFTASNWSCNSIPTAASDVIIPNVTRKPIVDGTGTIAVANTITVSSGASLTVNSGNTLKVTDKVTNNSGTITFEDSASLVQENNVTNSGNITYKRNAGVRNTDYTYWSSPVSPLNLAGVGGISYSPASLAGSIFYSYLVTASSENWKSETAATPMSPGLGYSIRAAGAISTNPPSLLEASFTGVPNNGTILVPIAKSDASYLLGNPYPSAIDADAFINANSAAIDGTLYFWTHNTPIAIGTPNPGSGIYAYSGNDYATYTLSGGVGTSGNFNDTNGNGIMDPGEEVVSNKPTGKIAAGQGFFTTSTTATGNFTFTNGMRVNGFGNPFNNTQFYKTKNLKAKTTTIIEKNRVWLNLTNKEGAFKQTLVGYITGASNTLDKLYDGESFDGNDFLDFYSINDEKNLTIQGRALPFDENDEIPLGYRIAVEGTFAIRIDETDGLLANQNVFLEDKVTNKTVNLKEGKYTFNTTAGTFDKRFVLRYIDRSTAKTLGTTDFDVKENTVLVSVKNKQIKINSFAETIDKLTIFDLLGRQIYQKDKINNNELLITDFRASHQTLIVKTSLQNGTVVTEKIIF
jgi:hypothetical protein